MQYYKLILKHHVTVLTVQQTQRTAMTTTMMILMEVAVNDLMIQVQIMMAAKIVVKIAEEKIQVQDDYKVVVAMVANKDMKLMIQ